MLQRARILCSLHKISELSFYFILTWILFFHLSSRGPVGHILLYVIPKFTVCRNKDVLK